MNELISFEGFAGYGGGTFAAKLGNIPYNCIGYSEINKYSIQCYNHNHKKVPNYGDISMVKSDDLPYFNLFLGGFPCQDVSLAGKRNLSKGRTNLYNEIIRITEDKKPKYMLLENVKGLTNMLKELKSKISSSNEKLKSEDEK